MEQPDYGCRFHAALAKAFASPDMAVRMAYFDLAEFYRHKIDGACALHPSAEVFGPFAPEAHR